MKSIRSNAVPGLTGLLLLSVFRTNHGSILDWWATNQLNRGREMQYTARAAFLTWRTLAV